MSVEVEPNGFYTSSYNIFFISTYIKVPRNQHNDWFSFDEMQTQLQFDISGKLFYISGELF